MAVNLDKYFGIAEQSLYVQSQRAELISKNLANSETPYYKAKDIDFRSVLQDLQKKGGASSSHGNLLKTSSMHMDLKGGGKLAPEMYRTPTQPDPGNGNTVETQHEHTAFAETNLRYNMSLNFLTGKIKGMKTAITGQS
jgi:flagellar basal-body rod protein FlgB